MKKTFAVLWHAFRWLFVRFWKWQLVSWLVGAVLIALAFVLAQYAWYSTGKVFLLIGALLLVGRIVHDAYRAEDIGQNEKVVACAIVAAVLAGAAYGGCRLIDDIEWKNEVVIKVKFSLFTSLHRA